MKTRRLSGTSMIKFGRRSKRTGGERGGVGSWRRGRAVHKGARGGRRPERARRTRVARRPARRRDDRRKSWVRGGCSAARGRARAERRRLAASPAPAGRARAEGALLRSLRTSDRRERQHACSACAARGRRVPPATRPSTDPSTPVVLRAVLSTSAPALQCAHRRRL